MTARSARRVLLACSVAILAALAPSATAAAASYDEDTAIVKWRAGVPAAERVALQERVGVERTLWTIHGTGAAVVEVDADPATVVARLDGSPLVEYAATNDIVRAASTMPNDARFGEQWALHNVGLAGGTWDADIDAPEAWAAAGLGEFPTGRSVPVAVIDTGVQAEHEDLQGKIVACGSAPTSPVSSGGRPNPDVGVIEGVCTDDHGLGHGTGTAGVIGAIANNGKGIAGVAFDSPLIICKSLFGPQGSGTSAMLATCITWAHDLGAKVISMSLGVARYSGDPNPAEAAAVRYAWENGGPGGSVLVAAAGNTSNSTVWYPAGDPEVVSVAATDRNDQHPYFSNFNDEVEIAAPGVEILTTYTTGYLAWSGTSFAAPQVAGAAALIWRLNPEATAEDVRAKLDAAVDDLGPTGRDPYFGFGRLNLLKAVTG